MQILYSMLVLMAKMYQSMEQKLRAAEEKNTKLTALLEKRTEMLRKFGKTIATLEEEFGDNERQLEMQRSELKEQYAILREMHTALLMKTDGKCWEIHHKLSELGLPGENCQQFWVFRKHKQNLVILTKPHIQEIIKAATEAGLVSESVGKCATKCPFPNHDCTTEFYKALQVKIGESPDTLKIFLQLVQDKCKESQPCLQFIHKKILNEITKN